MPLPQSLRRDDSNELTRLLLKRDAELVDARNRIRQLEEALDTRASETAALRRIAEATGHIVNSDDLLPLIAEVARDATGTDSALVYLFNETKDALVLRATTDKDIPKELIGQFRLPVGEGITGWVAQNRRHVALSTEAWTDDRFVFVPGLLEERYQSILSVPLFWKGEVIGVVNVRTLAPHDYTKTQVQLLSSIASQVAGAIEASRRVRRAEKKASHLSTVADVSRAITSDLYLEEILQLAVTAASRFLNFRVVALSLVDTDREQLVLKAVQSAGNEYPKRRNLALGEGLAGKVLESGQPVTVLNVREAPEYQYTDLAEKEGLTSLACIPLKVRDRVIGVLACYTAEPHLFTADELAVLTTLGNQIAVAIENSKLMVKGALLQEMHHRVKNNLQQIASLLRLQKHYAADRSPEEVLEESISRVLAVSAVHDLLSREDLDTINVRKIAESIITATQQNLTLPNRRIHMSVEGPDLRLGSQHANSLALILNEMVQNAVEHGFHRSTEGEIQVRWIELPEHWSLEVRNTGDPLKADFNPQRDRDLGLQIVESLTRGDLGGEFQLCSRDGWTIASARWPKTS